MKRFRFFLVHLKSTDKIKTLHNKLHAIFPNPYNHLYQILITYIKYRLSDKRINLIDSNLSVLEHVYLTDEIRLENLDKNFRTQLTIKISMKVYIICTIIIKMQYTHIF